MCFIHPELSGCITTLSVCRGCKLLCSNGHLERSRWCFIIITNLYTIVRVCRCFYYLVILIRLRLIEGLWKSLLITWSAFHFKAQFKRCFPKQTELMYPTASAERQHTEMASCNQLKYYSMNLKC